MLRRHVCGTSEGQAGVLRENRAGKGSAEVGRAGQSIHIGQRSSLSGRCVKRHGVMRKYDRAWEGKAREGRVWKR